MSEIDIMSFTKNGVELSKNIGKIIPGAGLYTKCSFVADDPDVRYVGEPLAQWTGKRMAGGRGLVFIGACGIAVRAVSPFVRDKLSDSPVIVMDEAGNYVIPLLSGHIGGANALAVKIASAIGAQSVITTATDINGKFAVDMFAKENGLYIENREGVAKVSARILDGEKIKIFIQRGHRPPDDGLYDNVELTEDGKADVYIAAEGGENAILRLRPKEYIIGVGCRRGTDRDDMEKFILQAAAGLKIPIDRVFAIATIDIKKNEPAVLSFCGKYRLPLLAFSAEELMETEGEFSSSDFVMEKTGTDNVCERAALRACGEQGSLVKGKTAFNGMTIAVAKRQWRVRFYGK